MHFGDTLHFGDPGLYIGGSLRQRTWVHVQVSMHPPFGIIATSFYVAPRRTMDFRQPVVPWITNMEIHFSAICYTLCSAKGKHGFLLTFEWLWNEKTNHRKKLTDKIDKMNDYWDKNDRNEVTGNEMSYLWQMKGLLWISVTNWSGKERWEKWTICKMKRLLRQTVTDVIWCKKQLEELWKMKQRQRWLVKKKVKCKKKSADCQIFFPLR